MKVAVIIPAAGRGERFGSAENKTFAKLGGRPVFLRTIEHFINREDVCQTIVVVSGGDMTTMKEKYAANLAFMGVTLVEGGATRSDSVSAGLKAVGEEATLVAIHDAARPCVTESMIDAVFAEASKSGAAILASPLHGTIKRVSDAGVIDATVAREGLYEAQTPQVFKRSLIVDVYSDFPPGAEQATDDAQIVEFAGHAVSVVESDGTNLKITTKADMTLANAILKARPAAKPVKRFGAYEEAQW
ncbi:MAG: 2-C-methyl-D-erythritol 4-phosphate cytidylyltransferase [Planctomycetes bacterium]|nr:2-C-methyl-D-erythritol 4-phosphate cytidylyltransferase [Planctomycetota bacterium]